MNDFNLILATDSYKAGHARIYKPGTQTIYSYLESRGGRFPYTVFFGLQYYLKHYLSIPITKKNIDDAEIFWDAHFGRANYFDRSKWDYILEKHGGCLPLKIRAVPEGSKIPVSNVLMTIENTDDNCYWLTNFVETLLMKVWYPITVATQSHFIKKDIVGFLEKSGNPELADFKCHDFSYRGCHSEESSALGSSAHLLSFLGTDTVSGILLAQEYYKAGMVGFSIPASEHSNVCSYGRWNEEEFCENYLDLYPQGLIASVSDTYNIYNCVSKIWGEKLRDKILKRKGTLIIRPDSGNYLEIVPWILNELGEKFGHTTNKKGYKVLNDVIRGIQGDGMEPTTINELFKTIIDLGWSADNLAVGSGGGLLVKDLTRDTCQFAIKASAAKINNQWIEIYKEATGKVSKRGRVELIKHEGKISTVKQGEWPYNAELLLQTVFENGKLIKEYTFEEIRKNAAI